MLAYAASRPVVVDRRPHPHTLPLIIGVHVAVAALVMSAKMDLPTRHWDRPETLVSIPIPKAPPPKPQAHPVRTQPQPSPQPPPTPRESLTPRQNDLTTGQKSQPADSGPSGGGETVTVPKPIELPLPTIPGSGPKLLTPQSDLKPPYPASKLLNEEEAVLTLRLTIDENGRVTAVDPVGRADPAFLDSARRHLLAHWRYQPATKDGHAVGSTTVVTLRFQLDA